VLLSMLRDQDHYCYKYILNMAVSACAAKRLRFVLPHAIHVELRTSSGANQLAFSISEQGACHA